MTPFMLHTTASYSMIIVVVSIKCISTQHVCLLAPSGNMHHCSRLFLRRETDTTAPV